MQFTMPAAFMTYLIGLLVCGFIHICDMTFCPAASVDVWNLTSVAEFSIISVLIVLFWLPVLMLVSAHMPAFQAMNPAYFAADVVFPALFAVVVVLPSFEQPIAIPRRIARINIANAFLMFLPPLF
jgi:hypothetical protein